MKLLITIFAAIFSIALGCDYKKLNKGVFDDEECTKANVKMTKLLGGNIGKRLEK